MTTIKPNTLTTWETRFQIETEKGNFYQIKIEGKSMRVFKMVQNDYSGDWIEGQVSGLDISEEVKDMLFTNLVPNKDVTYREMEALYVSQQFGM